MSIFILVLSYRNIHLYNIVYNVLSMYSISFIIIIIIVILLSLIVNISQKKILVKSY